VTSSTSSCGLNNLC